MAEITPSNPFIWLRDRISEVVPDWFRAMFLGQRMAISLFFRQQVSEITHEPRGQVAPVSWLGNLPENRKKKEQTAQLADVYFPPSVFLERRVSIPNGAEKNIQSIVELDMVRRTPFRPDEVYWTCSGRDNAGDVVQWVARKSDIHDILKNLTGHWISVRQIFVDAPGASAAMVVFDTQKSGPAKILRLMNLGLAVAILVFLLFAWLFPAWQAFNEGNSLSAETEELRAQALQIRADVDGFRSVETSKSDLLTLLRERPRLSVVLRNLTVALPDTVWSDNLVFSSDRVVFTGTTETSAAELVLQLSRSRQFENPRLSGPVSRTSNGGERFEIAAELGVD